MSVTKHAFGTLGGLCAVLVWACGAEAGEPLRTLYVNVATGDDSRTVAQAQNQATPWRMIGRAAWGSANRGTPNAAQAAQAGDLVLIAAGVYWTDGDPQPGRWNVALNPVNHGTA